ncbi:hypothetical protein EDC01DRAFT_786778 [Geopyxis carbonaria]|nr:hypothetical protein EDC01DRAFT_786778 [Geopyxis carbonaria]
MPPSTSPPPPPSQSQSQSQPHNASIPAPSLPASCDPPSPTRPPTPQVWLIFGATGHLGRSITRHCLSRGDLVTAVGRNIPSEAATMRNWHPNCLGLVCDVRSRPTIAAVLRDSLAHWGRVDVVVNATGYGIIGAFEDQDAHDVAAQFETNVTGLVNIFAATLPYFRGRRAGRYIVFSSLHGLSAVPGLGPYCATKWAVEGLTESLMFELDPLNVRVTLVEPGPSRRDEPDENVAAPSPMWGHFLMKPPAEEYRAPTSPANHAMRMVDWLRFRQPTSAVKVAGLVWELGHCGAPPLRLLLGSQAVESVRDRLRAVIEEIEDWRGVNGSKPVAVEEGGREGREEGDKAREGEETAA